MQKTVITLFLLTLMLQLNGQNAQLFKSIANDQVTDEESITEVKKRMRRPFFKVSQK